nr:Toll/interleukin-1 receptor (TIR) domain-containing protein [Tanacetum cinerariifolium]
MTWNPPKSANKVGLLVKLLVNMKMKRLLGNGEALKEAADLAGWELKNTNDRHEAEFIEKIVQEISLELRSINFGFDEKLVGMETRVINVISSLEIDIDDVRVIGIKDMGGAGKTTIARAVFDHLSNVSKLKAFLGIVDDGKDMMIRKMFSKKVLLVLDDVDHIDQLEALASGPKWFKPRSRIIVATRDEQVLVCIWKRDSTLRIQRARSLITISKHGFLGMHDHIEEMGKNIVRRSHPDEPNQHSRLCINEEIKDILANDKRLKKLKFLCISKSALTTFDIRVTPNLEMLSLESSCKLVERCMPSSCQKLKYLCMSHSKVSVACTNLKILHLSNSRLRSLDLELIPNLERLVLKEAHELVELNAPFGCLKKVGYLNISGCLRFSNFEFHGRWQLKDNCSSATLNLVGESLDSCALHLNSNLPKLRFYCYYQEDLPSSVGNIEKLISFGSLLEKLPESLLEKLPEDLGQLDS